MGIRGETLVRQFKKSLALRPVLSGRNFVKHTTRRKMLQSRAALLERAVHYRHTETDPWEGLGLVQAGGLHSAPWQEFIPRFVANGRPCRYPSQCYGTRFLCNVGVKDGALGRFRLKSWAVFESGLLKSSESQCARKRGQGRSGADEYEIPK